MESGPPDTARTSAGAVFQSANRRFASLAEIGEWSSLLAMTHCKTADPVRSSPAASLRRITRSALDPFLLAIDGGFDAAGGARIFPQYLAEGGAGGLLLLQRRQRLSEPQQRVRGFRRFIEFGGHPEKGFGGVTVFLALEIALAQPVLRIGDQGIAGIFRSEIAHGLFGQCIVLALHIADAEVELVLWRRRGRQSGQRGTRARRASPLGRRTAGIGEIKRLAGAASAGSADRAFGRHRQLTAAERA